MNADGARAGRRAGLICFLLWTLAFTLACRLLPGASGARDGQDSVAARLLGSSRVALGDSFYERSDTYFHRGVSHRHEVAFSNTLFQLWREALQPSLHLHTEGYSLSEIMPWMRLTTQLDPQKVEAYLTMAYLLKRLRRLSTAERVLLEAQSANPHDHRILEERARLAFQLGLDDKAARLLEVGIRLWPGPLDRDDPEAALELARMYSLRALLHEMRGEVQAALDDFRHALEYMPQNEALAHRVRLLEQGQTPPPVRREVMSEPVRIGAVCAHHKHSD